MKKRAISLALVLALVVSFAAFAPSVAPVAKAASDAAQYSANMLYSLGLFKGTGTNSDGTPVFDLDRSPTRAEGIVMLVRLLGKETEAQSAKIDSFPFYDVEAWAKPYVNYAYNSGYTTGMGEGVFGSYDLMSASQYITLVLRALGYRSGVDFAWDSAWTLSDSLGLTDGSYYAGRGFTRGDAAQISYNALLQNISGKNTKLLAYLCTSGAVSGTALANTGLNWATKGSESGYSGYPYVPDFGLYFGIPVAATKSEYDNVIYYYNTSAVAAADPSGSMFAAYKDLLLKWNLAQNGTNYNTYGEVSQYLTRATDNYNIEKSWDTGVETYKVTFKLFGKYNYPKKVVGYIECPDVPDLGIFFAAAASKYSMTAGSVNSFSYYYKYTDVYQKDKNAYATYTAKLFGAGFTYIKTTYSGTVSYFYFSKGNEKLLMVLDPGNYLLINVTIG